jgi:hypothetical protein
MGGINGELEQAHRSRQMVVRRVLYGRPCAHCRCYYESDLEACPVCRCTERIPLAAATERSLCHSVWPEVRP